MALDNKATRIELAVMELIMLFNGEPAERAELDAKVVMRDPEWRERMADKFARAVDHVRENQHLLTLPFFGVPEDARKCSCTGADKAAPDKCSCSCSS